ncbi:hypothetical protein GCM10027416_22700 [Okibacterium endophyticum]
MTMASFQHSTEGRHPYIQPITGAMRHEVAPRPYGSCTWRRSGARSVARPPEHHHRDAATQAMPIALAATGFGMERRYVGKMLVNMLRARSRLRSTWSETRPVRRYSEREFRRHPP